MVISLAGGGSRFVSIIMPAILIILGFGLSGLLSYAKAKGSTLTAAVLFLSLVVIAYEFYFSYQSQVSTTPTRIAGITHATDRPSYVGYKELDDYLDGLLGEVSPVTLISLYPDKQVVEYQKNAFVENTNKLRKQLLIVYDDRINWSAGMWILERRKLYDGHAIISFEQYSQLLELKEDDFMSAFGVEEVYFIFLNEDTVPVRAIDENNSIQVIYDQFRNGPYPSSRIFDQNNNLSFEIFLVEGNH